MQLRRLVSVLKQIGELIRLGQHCLYAPGPASPGSIAAPQPVASRKRTLGQRRLDRVGQLPAVHASAHAHVRDHHVKRLLGQLFQRLFPGRGHADQMT